MKYLGSDPTQGLPTLNGSLKVVPLGPPIAPTVTPNATAAGTYTYAIQAYDVAGNATVLGAATTITNGPTTLDGSHTITVSWTAPVGTYFVELARTAGGPSQGTISPSGVPLQLPASGSYTDAGATTLAGGFPSADQTGGVSATSGTVTANLVKSTTTLNFAQNTVIASGTYNRNFNTTGTNYFSVAALTAIYTLSVTAGLLGTAGALRVKIAGTYLANSSTPTFRFQVLFGATVLWDGTTAALSAVATSGAFDITLILGNASTGTQVVEGSIRLGNRTAPATGTGTFGTLGGDALFHGTAAEDSTVAKNLIVKFLPSVNNAAVGLTVTTVIAELLP